MGGPLRLAARQGHQQHVLEADLHVTRQQLRQLGDRAGGHRALPVAVTDLAPAPGTVQLRTDAELHVDRSGHP